MKSFDAILSDKRSALADRFGENADRIPLSQSIPAQPSNPGNHSGRVMVAGEKQRIDLRHRLQEAAESRIADELVRHRRVLSQRKDARVLSDGNRLINFSSNDYLGLAQRVTTCAWIAGARCHGIGRPAHVAACPCRARMKNTSPSLLAVAA
jgi:hypothetical protein